MNIDKAKKLVFEYSYYFQQMFPDCDIGASCHISRAIAQAHMKDMRFNAHAIRPEVHEAINHIIWMANEMQTFDSLGKVMRWLGFIQGCMWTLGSKSIAELKSDNFSSANASNLQAVCPDCGAERMYHDATNTTFPCGIGLKICLICGKHPIHDLERCIYCYKDFINSIPG